LKRRDVLIALALFVLTLLIFAPARHHEFLNFDDPRYVFEPMVRQGLTVESIRWAFTTFNFANYHPITWLSHMIDAQLFGTNPAGHHFHSVLLHAINAVIVYLVIRSLTGRGWESAAVAAMFALHPLRVESVAWAAERKDLLFLLFFMLSIGAYARWVKQKSWWSYAASLVLFALSLMSKPMAVSLPVVLILLDQWPLKRPARWNLMWEKLPFVALSVASAIVTMIAQKQGGAMSESVYTPGLRAMNAIWAYGEYLLLTVWPNNLAIFYPYYGAIPDTMLPVRDVILAGVVLVMLTATAILLWRRECAVLVGWLWFVITLVPTIGIVQVGAQSMADRYTYLPHIGLMIAIVFGVAAFVRSRPTLRIAAGVVTAIVLIALSIRTYDQLRYWRNNVTVFNHALDVTTHNNVAHSGLGLAYVDENRLSDAIAEYKRAIAIKPADAQPYYNIGVLMMRMGRVNESRSWLDQALARYPNSPETLVAYGNYYVATGDEVKAIDYFRRAVEVQPTLQAARYNLGLSLTRIGRPTEALPHLAEAVRIAPHRADTHFIYALALQRAGRGDEAQPHWDAAQKFAEQQQNAAMLEEIERYRFMPPTTRPAL
jgi:Flp pilus assembly protein TadD